MNHLIVPTDFSNNAWNAAQMAAQIAAGAGATLHLLHITFDLQNPLILNEETRETYNDGRFEALGETLTERKDQLQKAFPELTIRHKLLTGNTEDTILKYAQNQEADMIVMGTQGDTGVKKVIVGSVTVSMIMQSTIPVLCVPGGYKQTGEYNIILADSRLSRSPEFFAPTLALARALKSKVTVFHINEGGKPLDKNQKKDYEKYLTEQQLEIENSLIETGEQPLEEAIQNTCDLEGYGILALVNIKQGFFGRLFRPGLVREMAFQSEIPLLVQPHRETGE